jgi:hypothetical protein
VAIKKSSEKNRMVTNINLKCIGSPATNSLDDVGRDARLRESCHTTSPEGMASYIRGEMLPEASNEPTTSGDQAVLA